VVGGKEAGFSGGSDPGDVELDGALQPPADFEGVDEEGVVHKLVGIIEVLPRRAISTIAARRVVVDFAGKFALKPRIDPSLKRDEMRGQMPALRVWISPVPVPLRG
jgi:hypothetical protein